MDGNSSGTAGSSASAISVNSQAAVKIDAQPDSCSGVSRSFSRFNASRKPENSRSVASDEKGSRAPEITW